MMAQNFRRRISQGARRFRRRFRSLNNLHEVEEASKTSRQTVRGKNRVHSVDNLDFDVPHDASTTNGGSPRRIAWQETSKTENCCDVLTKQWMEEWQEPLVVPFGQAEFRRRVESVRSAILVEMDKELARDMRTYNLAGRRHAICTEMFSPQLEKAACTLGILGF